ncbi:MAG: ubiquinone/menaquinone biosynthesis methylase-like protein [uncultured bacterium]|nr:MAG: ubiquinone/menaquinone biosynthesis methylase-like protein [uncultured bacterium]
MGDGEVKATKELLRLLRISAVVKKYDGIKIPYPSNTFDIVTSIEVIEHVNKPLRMLEEIHRVLKKDGILHITTANKWWPIEPHFKLPFLSYLPAKIADSYVRLLGRGDSYHNIRLPSYKQFRQMVQNFFTVEDITLDFLKSYKMSGLDKERGKVIVVVADVLQGLNFLKKFSVTRAIAVGLETCILHVSLGWLFIGRTRK